MFSNDLRLVAIRYIDRLKNQYYEMKVQSVWYEDGVPIAYSDPYQPVYAFKRPFTDFNIDHESTVHYREMLEEQKRKVCAHIDEKIEACKRPVLYFPDHFKDGKNEMREIQAGVA